MIVSSNPVSKFGTYYSKLFNSAVIGYVHDVILIMICDVTPARNLGITIPCVQCLSNVL
jgi:hypothetical protein